MLPADFGLFVVRLCVWFGCVSHLFGSLVICFVCFMCLLACLFSGVVLYLCGGFLVVAFLCFSVSMFPHSVLLSLLICCRGVLFL